MKSTAAAAAAVPAADGCGGLWFISGKRDFLADFFVDRVLKDISGKHRETA